MKIKFGAMVVDGRGKLGGHVASKNRSGSYFRTKVTPVNPQTTRQSAVRSALTGFSQAFRGLTAAQITAWNSAVQNFSSTDVFGDLRNPSGLNLFMKLNMNLSQVGVAQIDDPPLPSSVEVVTSVSLSADSSPQTFSITFAPTPVPANTAFIIEATAGVSAGKSFVKSEFRQIGYLDAAATSPANQLTAYTNKFGTLIAGQKIFVKLTPVNKITGQRGLALQAYTVVL